MNRDKKTSSVISRLEKGIPTVISLGYCIYDPLYAQKFHSTPGASELQYVIHGSVRVKTKKWSYTANPGSVIYMPMNTYHLDEFDISKGLEVFLIFFRWNMEKDYLKIVAPNRLPTLSSSTQEEIGRLFEHIRTNFTGGSKSDQMVAGGLVLTILFVIMRDILRKQGTLRTTRSDKITQHSDWIMLETRRFLESHYHEPIRLNDIARAIGVSAFYLSHIFNQASDFSLVSYLMELRMNKAKKLLSEGHLNVAETARAVGYRDSNYFSRVYTKYFGVSPKKMHGSSLK